jgi:potassium efflux system protein
MARSRRLAMCCAIGLLACAGLVSPLRAQGHVPWAPPHGRTVSEAAITQRLAELPAANLDEPTRAAAATLYQQALQEIRAARSSAALVAGFDAELSTAAQEMERVRRQLAQLQEASPPEPNQDASLAQLQQELAQLETDLAAHQKALADLEAWPKHRAARRVEIPKLLSTARQSLQDLERQSQLKPATEEAPALTAARNTLRAARRQAVAAEIAALEKELASYEGLQELKPLARDLAARQVALAEAAVQQWRGLVDARRQQEAQGQLRQAQLEAAHADPAVRALAERNSQLAGARSQLAQKISETTQDLDTVRRDLQSLEAQIERTRERVDAVGLTDAIGMLLRKQREELQQYSQRRGLRGRRQAQVQAVRLQLYDLEDRRSALSDADAAMLTVLGTNRQAPPSMPEQVVQSAVRELLETQRQYLDLLIRDYNTYFDKLVELDNAEQQLQARSAEFAQYVDERVLWIRSTSLWTLADVRHGADALAWLVQPGSWLSAAGALLDEVFTRPIPALLALLVFGTLFWFRHRLRKRIAELAEEAQRTTCTRFGLTPLALALTLLLVASWPGLLCYLGWQLETIRSGSPFVAAIAQGLMALGCIYLPLEFLRQVARKCGLAEAHFGWSERGCRVLRQQLQYLIGLGLPLVLFAATLAAQANERWNNALGRAAFVAAMLLLTVFLSVVLRPTGGLLQGVMAYRRAGWFDRVRYLWYPLCIVAPLSLALAAAAGYYFTALQLAPRLLWTLGLLWGVLLVGALLARWLLVHRRKLSFDQRRAALQHEAATNGTHGASAGRAAEPAPNLSEISDQTRQLLQSCLVLTALVGVWLIWVDVFPALSILDRIELWQTTVEFSQTADGSGAVQTVNRLTSITVADVLVAAVILGMTLIAVKNAPGLLEIILLRRLPFDAGMRYAITTISVYGLTIAGLLLACGRLGLHWSQLQWLVAALGVGLGFGLQEIFANFVAGLIILFEQPVRVGDVVTVGDTTGVVSRIRIRATTIVNWDRQELVVPNKEFITARLLNWTLSDQVNRVTIPVGIAYGSDTELARQLLLKAAQEHPLVLRDPPPQATFDGFGESTLHLTLRAFLPSLENRPIVIHDLHTAIDRAFRQAHIELAFPQRDVHIRTIMPAAAITPLPDSNQRPAKAA